MDIRAVIMAGGTGTRFWPLSRKKRPKQFLPIISKLSMIEETVQRLLPRIPPSQIYTIADREQTELIRTFLRELPEKNFMVEPLGKNTAPCLTLATAVIYKDNPDAVIAVLPADHLIKDPNSFLDTLFAGAEAAYSKGNLITFGIPPDYPATGYGYICFSRKNTSDFNGKTFFPVIEFKEKPKLDQAEEFVRSGNYFWNSGMFLWKANVFSQKLKEVALPFYNSWHDILNALIKEKKTGIKSIYEKMPAISIDYALMEKASDVLMAEGDFGWSDVGSWSSLLEIWAKDGGGNTIKGDAIQLDSQNCLCYNPEKFTALVGVKDIIVVNTEDALLVCRKDLDQKVKDVVQKLQILKKEELL
ncbi:MAG: mannose-1-phosphate guanylyltransferase [Candidatus Aminicenantes bacterium]|nr:mannose-1-phosphate guanylyltransferase [Candidatus Aminicenantes bacterium]